MRFAIYKDYDGNQYVGYVEIVDVDLLPDLQHCAIIPALIFGKDRQWSLKDFGLVPRVRVDTRPQKELGEMHPSVTDILQHFDYEHLPPDLQEVASGSTISRTNWPIRSRGPSSLLGFASCSSPRTAWCEQLG